MDFKAGFEDSARGVITSLDWAIVIVDPTSASIQMAANMRDMVDQIRAGVLPATAHLESADLVAMANRAFKEAKIKGVFFVLSQVDDEATERYLREKLGEKESILKIPWPAYDVSAMVEEEILIVIQVNGKLRSRITVPVDSSNEEVEKIALSDEKTQGWIAGKEIKKVIVVPKKLVNVVVR